MPRNDHLHRRGNTYYFRRRIPLDLVQRFRKSQITFSLGTSDPKLARQRRDFEDLKFNAHFEKLRTVPGEPGVGIKSLSLQETIRMVQDYVESRDSRAKTRELEDPVGTEAEKTEIEQELDYARSILKDDEDPRGRQWLYAEGTKLLGAPLQALDEPSSLVLHEILRRGLLELGQRRELRLENDFSRSFVKRKLSAVTQGEYTCGGSMSDNQCTTFQSAQNAAKSTYTQELAVAQRLQTSLAAGNGTGGFFSDTRALANRIESFGGSPATQDSVGQLISRDQNILSGLTSTSQKANMADLRMSRNRRAHHPNVVV